MRSILYLLVLSFSLSIFPSCGKKAHVCSGLNPELGSYNTKKRVHKARRHVSSMPERESLRDRKSQMKKTNKNSSAGKYGRTKGFWIFGKKKKIYN